MSNTTKQLLPSQIGCIDREWLTDSISILTTTINGMLAMNPNEDSLRFLIYKARKEELLKVQSKLFPIESILEDAFGSGSGYGCGFNDSDFEERKQTYLTQPITIKLE
jgi:hypothetical protein